MASQAWDGVETVYDLPGRGRKVKVLCEFKENEVVCDYNGVLLPYKDGRKKYDVSPEHGMGYMFEFKLQGTRMWCHATEEVPGPGRLINHSQCHTNVSAITL